MITRPILTGIAVLSFVALEASGQPMQQPANQESTSIMTMKDDLANRSVDIHWPPGFEPLKADLFSHNELFIKASCERVWQHLTEAPKWPQWYPNSRDVRIVSDSGAVLKDGSAFRWTTFGLATAAWLSRMKSAMDLMRRTCVRPTRG